MAKYYTLTGREPVLIEFKHPQHGLNADFKASAEEAADNFVDDVFCDFNTAQFAIQGETPPQIVSIARSVAVGTFRLLQSSLLGDDESQKKGKLAHSLMKQAEAAAKRIIDRGYLVAADGFTKITKINPNDGGSMSLDIAV